MAATRAEEATSKRHLASSTGRREWRTLGGVKGVRWCQWLALSFVLLLRLELLLPCRAQSAPLQNSLGLWHRSLDSTVELDGNWNRARDRGRGRDREKSREKSRGEFDPWLEDSGCLLAPALSRPAKGPRSKHAGKSSTVIRGVEAGGAPRASRRVLLQVGGFNISVERGTAQELDGDSHSGSEAGEDQQQGDAIPEDPKGDGGVGGSQEHPGGSTGASFGAAGSQPGDSMPDPEEDQGQAEDLDPGPVPGLDSLSSVGARKVASQSTAGANPGVALDPSASSNTSASLQNSTAGTSTTAGPKSAVPPPGLAPKPRKPVPPPMGTRRLLQFFRFLRDSFPTNPYRNFQTLMVKSGFHAQLSIILDTYPVTLFVPNNAAAPNTTLTKETLQRVSFHAMPGIWTAKALENLPRESQILTADIFPDGRVYTYKVSYSPAQFEGSPKSKSGGSLVAPDMYTSDFFVAHGIDKYLTPYRYFS